MDEKTAELSAVLKSKCVAFTFAHLLGDFVASPFAEPFIETRGGSVEGVLISPKRWADPEWISAFDQFILFGETENGDLVPDEIIRKLTLSKEEHDTLVEWKEKAFCSIFEVVGSGDDYLELTDIVDEVRYRVYFNRTPLGGFPISGFVEALIAPTKGLWFFSGACNFLPHSTNGT